MYSRSSEPVRFERDCAAVLVPQGDEVTLPAGTVGYITQSLGGVANGFPREDGFDITVASEVMAILCLASDLADLQDRLGRIIVARTRDELLPLLMSGRITVGEAEDAADEAASES